MQKKLKYAVSIYGKESTLIIEEHELKFICKEVLDSGKKLEYIIEYEEFKRLMKGPTI